MKKIIIDQHEDFSRNLQALKNASLIFSQFITALKTFSEKTRFVIFDFEKSNSTSIIEFLNKCSEIIPSRAEQSGVPYFEETDLISDHIKFIIIAKNFIADQGITFNNLPLNREALIDFIELPEPVTYNVVKLFRQAFSFHPSSKIRQYPTDFLEFIEVANGELIVRTDVKEILEQKFIIYANDSEMKVWEEVQLSLAKIIESKGSLQNLGLAIDTSPLSSFINSVSPKVLLKK